MFIEKYISKGNFLKKSDITTAWYHDVKLLEVGTKSGTFWMKGQSSYT